MVICPLKLSLTSWTVLTVVPFVVALLINTVVAQLQPRCEAHGVITAVVDGDTFDVTEVVYFEQELAVRINSTRFRVRLADINAPELGTPEGDMSKRALTQLVGEHKGHVCLDIDNLRTFDRYGRVIAVAYLRINETHFLNLNKWLLANGYANVWNFTDNEFDPAAWELFVVFSLEAASTTAPHTTQAPHSILDVVWSYAETFLPIIALAALFLIVVASVTSRRGRSRRARGR